MVKKKRGKENPSCVSIISICKSHWMEPRLAWTSALSPHPAATNQNIPDFFSES